MQQGAPGRAEKNTVVDGNENGYRASLEMLCSVGKVELFCWLSSVKNMCLKKEFEVQCAVVLSSNIVCVLFLLSKPFRSNKQDLPLNTLPTIIFAGAMLLNFVDV